MKPGVFWEANSETSAVAWKANVTGGGAISVSGPVGLVIWGPVNWRVLQGLGLSRWTHGRQGFPTWTGETPPTAQSLRRRWRAAAKHRQPWDDPDFARPSVVEERLFAQLNAMPKQEGERATFEPRRADESATEFYFRVATFYSTWLARNGKPTQTLAEAADVPKTTAARWVNEARRRGSLPPTKRGRARG